MSLLAELKRRNVIRVGALYLIAGWVLLQVSELLLGSRLRSRTAPAPRPLIS